MFTKNQEYIKNLILKINSEHKEIIVPVIVEEYAKPANCFPNVDEKIKRDGGSVVYGWSILIGQFLVEAERHAIWKSPNNELLDITPSTSEMTTTYFIPQDLVYTGQYIDNIRINKTKNIVVDDWCIVSSIRSAIFNTASRNGDYITIPKHIETLYYRYENINNIYYTYLMSGGNDNTNCFCSSGKPYNKCHGLMIKNECERDYERIIYLEKKYSKKYTLARASRS